MHRLIALKSRLHARTDSEHEQALLRIVIVGLVLVYMTVFHGWRNNWTPVDLEIVQVLSGFLILAISIFVAICVSPEPNVPRRLVGMVADAGGCTWYMWVAGEYGFFVIGIFLFITFGNGFRYGRRYLFGCQLLCLLGLGSVLLYVPYWEERTVAGVGLLIALVVLPLYVSTLLKRIQEARAKAEEANSAKTTFLANMSHEIRTPLNGIVGVVDLFKTTELSTHQQELVQLLRHSTTVLRSLVDDVLDISKIESGRLTIDVSSFDLYATVNGLIQLLRPHAASKGLTLHAVVDPELDYRLRGDSNHLRQILLNLLGNAVKFTERGEIVLGVTLRKATVDGVTARFEVKDTGIGIPPELLPRIFERFVQADQSATRRFGGSGLGTTIAKQLVELMGGTIGAQSRVGEGTTFWFELPLLRDEEAVATSGLTDSSADHQVRTLLIADHLNAQAIAPLIASAGERVETLSPSESFGARLDELTSSGIGIRAVVACCNVDSACAAFTSARQRYSDQEVALIYIASRSLSIVDSARIKSFREAFVLNGTPNPRIIANAIHAAIASTNRESAETIDLSHVLHQQRIYLRVLVADDNPTNQAIISQLLASAGHSVLLADDGDQALDLYEHESPDIALLDFNMPGRNGLEVIRAIRVMEPPGTKIPAIILSASVTPEARTRALESGADEFIGKPFDAASLIATVDKLAGRLKGRTGVRQTMPQRATDSEPARRTSPRGHERDPDNILNYDRLAEIEDIARDAQFTMELLRGFKSDVESLMRRLDSSASTNSPETIGDILHALKGAAVGIGASQLSILCDDLPAVKRSDSVEVARMAERIHSCAMKTFECLDDYVRRHHQVPL
jgi:two-component system, sensor histidine kinase RpfC